MTPEAWDNYTKMLKQSSEAVWAVARYIHKNGVDVTVKATHIAPSMDQYKQYIDEGDIVIHRNNIQEIVEVKHQSWKWTQHSDIPWDRIIVCARKSYDRHTTKPSAYFLVNQQLTHALVIPTTTQDQWETKVIRDKVKSWDQEMYMINPLTIEFVEL
jgi:hypothetical protein